MRYEIRNEAIASSVESLLKVDLTIHCREFLRAAAGK
jgi:hypothetical protein